MTDEQREKYKSKQAEQDQEMQKLRHISSLSRELAQDKVEKKRKQSHQVKQATGFQAMATSYEVNEK